MLPKMPYPAPVVNRPYFGYNDYQENSWLKFQRRPAQNRPIYHNGNTFFKKNQQGFDNCEQHWCETCDRGFNTLELLERHKQQHQKCNIDGCQFVAHPKVITKHIQMQHSSGLYKKIAKLNNPEEIKKWIEERKKKYPTKENIEKKSAEIKEKIERGEKMGLRKDRFNRNDFQGQGVKRKNHSSIGTNQQTKHMRQNNFDNSKSQIKKSKKEAQPKKVNRVVLQDDTRKLKPFTGIQSIDMDSDTGEETEQLDCNFEIEDDDIQTNSNAEEIKTNIEPTVCGALSSLICNYGSSDEENENTTQVPSKTNQIVEQTKENKVEIKADTAKTDGDVIKDIEEQNKSDDDSGPEEVKLVKPFDISSTEVVLTSSESITNTVSNINKLRKKDNVRERKRQIFIRPKPKVPSTLLQKLLHREVQHERNVILQCVRYIVKNNYFDN